MADEDKKPEITDETPAPAAAEAAEPKAVDEAAHGGDKAAAVATEDGGQPTKPEPKVKKAKKRAVSAGHAHILASFNNTIVTITDTQGNTLASASAGASGFRGSKKGTAYAGQIAAERAIDAAKQGYGVSKLEVFVKGVGLGRDAAVRTLINQKLEVESIKDMTTTAHGGVRPRKAKRN